MAVAARSRIRVKVAVAGGETVVFICRQPTAAEQSRFLNARFEQKGRKVESRLYPARATFMDQIALDIEGAEYELADGTLAPLTAATVLSDEDRSRMGGIIGQPVKSWKDLIPMAWKSQAAQRFEDGTTPDDEEDEPEKN